MARPATRKKISVAPMRTTLASPAVSLYTGLTRAIALKRAAAKALMEVATGKERVCELDVTEK